MSVARRTPVEGLVAIVLLLPMLLGYLGAGGSWDPETPNPAEVDYSTPVGNAVSPDIQLDLTFLDEPRLQRETTLLVSITSRRTGEVTLDLETSPGIEVLGGPVSSNLRLEAGRTTSYSYTLLIRDAGNQRLAASVSGSHLVGAHRVLYVNALADSAYVGDVPVSEGSGLAIVAMGHMVSMQGSASNEALAIQKQTGPPMMPLGQDEFGFLPQNPGTLVVTGTFVFLNETSALEPLWWGNVFVWDEDTFSADDLLWNGFTDTNGEFVTPPLDQADEAGTLDIYVELRLDNGDTLVMPSSGSSPYSGVTSTTANVPDGTFDVGTLQPTGADFEAATRIFHQLDSHGWLFGALLGDDLGGVAARYPSPDGGPHYHPLTSSTYGGEVHIPSGSDWDRAEDVTLHEHGHYVMDWAYTPFDPSAGGPHSLCDDSQDRGLSWSEGWATAWALFALNDPIFSYPSGPDIDYEAATYCSEDATHHDHSEFRVSAALWDMYDGGAEAYDIFPAWGADEIWSVLKAHDDAHYQDFYSSWLADLLDGEFFLMTAFQNTIDYDLAPTIQVTEPNAAGWFMGSMQVEAVATDSDNAVRYVDFWYSVNGNTFVYIARDTDTPYSIAWDASGINSATVWIRAQSFDGMKVSTFDLSDESFGVDNLPPTTSPFPVGTLGDGGWYTSPITLTLTASDGLSGVAVLSYRVDTGPWQIYTGTLSLSVDGIHTVDFYSVDVAGNNESVRTLELRLDQTAPDTISDLSGTPGNDPWFLSSVRVTLLTTDTTSGVAAVSYSLDGGPLQDYTSPFTIGGDGIHSLVYFARDEAGNVAVSESVEIRIDTTSPAFLAASPEGVITSSEVTLMWVATDNHSGIARYEVSVDGVGFVSVGLNTTITFQLTDGDHIVVLRAVDTAGQMQTHELRFRVDTNILSITGPYAGIPLYAIIAGGIVLLTLLIIRRRGKAKTRARTDLSASDTTTNQNVGKATEDPSRSERR